MRSYILLTIIISMLLLIGCSLQSKDSGIGGEEKDSDSTVSQDGTETSGDAQGAQRNEGFVLKAIVKSTSDPNRIEAEVIESDYAFGIYWVLTSGDTVFYSADGVAVSRDAIKVGDTVEITYGGQVMMSYPPQIVASKISVVK